MTEREVMMEILYSIPPTAEFSAEFSVPWQEGERLRISRGYYAASSVSDVLQGMGLFFRSGETRRSAQRRATELALECALAGLPAGGAAWCADVEPWRMSETGSRSFCYGYMDSLHRNHLPFPPEDSSLPGRERRFLSERAALLRPGKYRRKKPSAEICGKGLLYLTEHILQKRDGRGLLGRSLCILGGSEAADTARAQARRMGCELCEDGDILLLFDRQEPFPQHIPAVVLEAVGCSLSVCETTVLLTNKTLLFPSLIHGAELALFESSTPPEEPRETDTLLRRVMERVYSRVLSEEGTPYHSAYAAAFRAMNENKCGILG